MYCSSYFFIYIYFTYLFKTLIRSMSRQTVSCQITWTNSEQSFSDCSYRTLAHDFLTTEPSSLVVDHSPLKAVVCDSA